MQCSSFHILPGCVLSRKPLVRAGARLPPATTAAHCHSTQSRQPLHWPTMPHSLDFMSPNTTSAPLTSSQTPVARPCQAQHKAATEPASHPPLLPPPRPQRTKTSKTTIADAPGPLFPSPFLLPVLLLPHPRLPNLHTHTTAPQPKVWAPPLPLHPPSYPVPPPLAVPCAGMAVSAPHRSVPRPFWRLLLPRSLLCVQLLQRQGAHS